MYTDDLLTTLFKESTSGAEILRKLNLKPAGGNYKTLKKRLIALGLSLNDLKRQGWSKGKQLPARRSLDEYLINGSTIRSSKLKTKLLKNGLKQSRCEYCKLSEWLSEPIPLELHHINGIHDDNRLENLQILCPNCHAKTSTYRGRNIGA